LHAKTLKAIANNLSKEEIKRLTRQMVNDGKSLEDIAQANPSFAKSLRAFKKVNKAARAALFVRIVKVAGPAFAALAAIGST